MRKMGYCQAETRGWENEARLYVAQKHLTAEMDKNWNSTESAETRQISTSVFLQKLQKDVRIALLTQTEGSVLSSRLTWTITKRQQVNLANFCGPHRMAEFGRDLFRLPCPTALLKQEHLEQRGLLNISKDGDSISFLGNLCQSHLQFKKKKLFSGGNSCVSLCLFASFSVTGHHWRESSSVSLQMFAHVDEIPHCLLFSRLNTL